MKRNFLKNSLAALAFSFAIIASFAFSNAQNEEVSGQEYVWNPLTEQCVTTTKFCNELSERTCTVDDTETGTPVYDIPNLTGTACINLLTHDPNQ